MVWQQLVALGLTATQLWVIVHHPEPGLDEPGAADKPPYACLVRPATVLGALVLAVLGAGAISLWLPIYLQPGWLVWCSAALVLVGVDALTTWLPIRAAVLAEALLAAGVLLSALLAPGPAPPLLAAALIGAFAAGGLFWLVWRFARTMGFGDVRLAAMVGALSAISSPQFWYQSLLAASIAAVIWGLITMLWRRYRPSPLGSAFAYGPGLWLGPWLAWAWSALIG